MDHHLVVLLAFQDSTAHRTVDFYRESEVSPKSTIEIDKTNVLAPLHTGKVWVVGVVPTPKSVSFTTAPQLLRPHSQILIYYFPLPPPPPRPYFYATRVACPRCEAPTM